MKTRWVAGTAGAIAVLAAGGASAQVTPGLQLGLETAAYEYEETFEGGSITDEGRMTGFSLEYGRRFGGFSFDARFRYAQGEIDHEASDGERLEDVPQAVGQLELLAGRPMETSTPGLTFTPHLGIGSRVLLDDSGGRTTQSGLEGYDREITYAYVPLGATLRAEGAGGRSYQLTAQYNWIVGGESRSEFSQIDAALPNVTVEFEDGHGLEISAAAWTPLGGGRIGLAPFFRRWSLDRSTGFVVEEPGVGAIEIFEPSNTTTELGVRLLYVF